MCFDCSYNKRALQVNHARNDKFLGYDYYHPAFVHSTFAAAVASGQDSFPFNYGVLQIINSFLVPNMTAKKRFDNGPLKELFQEAIMLNSIDENLSPEVLKDYVYYFNCDYSFVERYISSESLDIMTNALRWKNFRKHNHIKYNKLRLPHQLDWDTINDIFKYQFHLLRYCTNTNLSDFGYDVIIDTGATRSIVPTRHTFGINGTTLYPSRDITNWKSDYVVTFSRTEMIFLQAHQLMSQRDYD